MQQFKTAMKIIEIILVILIAAMVFAGQTRPTPTYALIVVEIGMEDGSTTKISCFRQVQASDPALAYKECLNEIKTKIENKPVKWASTVNFQLYKK